MNIFKRESVKPSIYTTATGTTQQSTDDNEWLRGLLVVFANSWSDTDKANLTESSRARRQDVLLNRALDVINAGFMTRGVNLQSLRREINDSIDRAVMRANHKEEGDE